VPEFSRSITNPDNPMMHLSRRHALLASLLLATGCAPTRRLSIPRVRSAEATLGDPLVLEPEEGIVAGVAIAAARYSVSQNLNLSLSRSFNRRFILADASGGQVSIPFGPVLEDTAEVEDSGAVLWITPFAIKLRAGTYTLIGDARLPASSDWILRTYPHALRIEVVAGEVAHIGGIGRLSQSILFSSQTARDAACEPADRDDNRFHGFFCKPDDRNFVRRDMARDRERILARFPALADRRLVDRPLAPAPGWTAWPEALLQPQ
jgi:hypothetical protein